MNMKACVFAGVTVAFLMMTLAVLMFFSNQRDVFYADLPALPKTAPNFKAIHRVEDRKARFFDYFESLAQLENSRLLRIRKELTDIQNTLNTGQTLSRSQHRRLYSLAEKYKVSEPNAEETCNALLKQIDIIPIALVQVQAAIESGWGRSRFAIEGNNYFGQWCFSRGCGITPARRETGKVHEVAVFSSPRESVAQYMLNLNRFHLYESFRQARSEMRNTQTDIGAINLAQTLLAYSERGQAYVNQVVRMIKRNKLETTQQILN